MLIIFLTLLLSTLNSTVVGERKLLIRNFVKPKRGIIETGRNVPNDYKYHQFQPVDPSMRTIQTVNPKSLSYRKDAKIVQGSPLTVVSSPSAYSDIFKQSQAYTSLPLSPYSYESRSNEQLSPYSDNLFTISAGYKVASNNIAKPLNQAGIHSQQKFNHDGAIGTNLQVPTYKTSYPVQEAAAPQIYGPAFQNKKASLPISQVQKSQQLPSYLSIFQNQPLVLNSADNRFNIGGRTPKVNNLQLSAPFLSPFSSFQGQTVPISTAANNLKFPRYKGATVEIYPNIGGVSTVAYQPLQTQPQLHFGHGNVQRVQPVDNLRHSTPSEEIRSDVEIIDKKKPTTPPPKKDDDDDDDDNDDNDSDKDRDEGYAPSEKYYGRNSEDDDDYESKQGKYFDAPPTEGNFKPSMSFPFKQYDEKFGKYSNQNRDEEADEKPFSKYRDYLSSNDDNNDERVPLTKYRSEDASSKPFYDKQENNEEEEEEEEDDDRQDEKQQTEETSDDAHRPKYFDNYFNEEFEGSYGRELPKQRYVDAKETPEIEYGSETLKKNKNNYESQDPWNKGSQRNFGYYKNSQDFKDTEGYSSDTVTSFSPIITNDGNF